MVQEAFSVNPASGVWIERGGKTARGSRPRYLDWPSHTAADMARESWKPAVRVRS